MTGFSSITTNKLIVGTTSAAAHIEFQREGYNYLAAPKNGIIAFSPGSTDAAGVTDGYGAHLAVTYGAVIPGLNNNVVDLGSSAFKWKNVYATTFMGALSGNATSADKWKTARNLTIGETAKSVDGSANVSWNWNEMGVQRSKKLTFTSTAYKTFVIPLCELTNDYPSINFYFQGSIYVKRENILADWLTRLDIICGKNYNTTDPIYSLTTHGGSGTNWTPVTFTYNNIKYFGIKCVVTGAGYEGPGCYAAGYATNWDIIEYTPIYNNHTSTILNAEIYNSLVELSGTSKAYPLIPFNNIYPRENEVFYLGTDTHRWKAVYAKTLYGDGANITALNASNINAGTLAAARLPNSGVTAGTYGLTAAASPAFGGTIKVPKVAVDITGRVTSAGEYNVTLPSLSLITGASATATATAAATSGNVHLNLVSNNTVLNAHKLLCSGPLTISSDASGNITFANNAYTKTQVDTNITNAINNLVNAAPGALDTLDELAAALGDDANFATTVTNLIGTKQATITGAATTITSSNLTANRALISNGDGKVAASPVTSTELGYLDGVTSAIQTQLNAKTPYATRSKATVATKGWYRIATTSVNIFNCSGLFQIFGAASGYHTAATVIAGTSYGIQDSSNISVLQCGHFSSKALTKVRIVYHTYYEGNYAYLEVYNPSDKAITITVKMIGGNGWTLVDPDTAGSIPSGYSNKEADLNNGTIYSEKFSGNGASLIGLNADNISAGTLSVARGGTGNTTMTANRLIWSENTSKLTAGNHYASSTKIAINSTSMPTETFYVNGSAKIDGALTATSFNLTSFAKTLTLSAANTWTDTGISGSNLSTGTYVIQIQRDGEYFSGVMSWTTGKDTSPNATEGYDEIVLHNAGSVAGSTSHIMARTVRTTSGIKLQICGNKALVSATVNIKCAKII